MAYRLIYNDTDALALIEAIGTTRTKHTVFTGTLDECRAEITRLNLTTTDEIATQLQSTQTLSAAKAAKIAQIASDRYDIETGGVAYGDYVILSDRDSISRLKETVDEIAAETIASVNWKCADNQWLTIDASNVSAIKIAVLTHVLTCFNAEKTAQETINAMTDIDEINAYEFTIG